MRPLAVAVVLLLGACGRDAVAPLEVPRTRSTAVRQPELERATEPVATERTSERELVKVEVQPWPGFDRVIFEFGDSVPGFKADYVAEVVQDGSGVVIPIEGAASLVLRMSAGEPLDTPTPTRLAGDTAVVTEVAHVSQVDDLVWAIGTRAKAPFTIATLDRPPRLVVDLKV